MYAYIERVIFRFIPNHVSFDCPSSEKVCNITVSGTLHDFIEFFQKLFKIQIECFLRNKMLVLPVQFYHSNCTISETSGVFPVNEVSEVIAFAVFELIHCKVTEMQSFSQM